MKQCTKCGKSGLFLKLDNRSLCKDCAAAVDAAAAVERQAKIEKASEFIREFGAHVCQAFATNIILPSMGAEKINKIIQECDYILAHIDDCKNYELFQDAFAETLQKDSRGWESSPLYPGHRVFLNIGGYIERLFNDIYIRAKEIRSKAVSAKIKAYDYTKTYKVVGVTFKNGRRSRQTILRAIYFEDPPYNGNVDIRLKKQDFEGEDAVVVYANDEQVGFISRDDLPWLLEHWNEYNRVLEFSVYGGGGSKSYGMEIRVAFVQKS